MSKDLGGVVEEGKKKTKVTGQQSSFFGHIITVPRAAHERNIFAEGSCFLFACTLLMKRC